MNIDTITELLLNKEVQLYKSNEKYEVKNADIYICLINPDVKIYISPTT